VLEGLGDRSAGRSASAGTDGSAGSDRDRVHVNAGSDRVEACKVAGAGASLTPPGIWCLDI
jgi:hypothetical protein